MRSARPVFAVAVGAALAVALVSRLARPPQNAEASEPAIARLNIAKIAAASAPSAPPAPALAGLDLTKIELEGEHATAPLAGGKVARLTIDPKLQRDVTRLMATHRLPEATVVVMDVESGEILAYASHVQNGKKRDLAVEATAPAASIFKIVTGASLVENAKLEPSLESCYSGGAQRITAQDLIPDPRRDRWCATLSSAMGRSINTIFARLATDHLERAELERTARSLGFGAPLPFDVPVEASEIRLPDDRLGFARTAAGFWNTTLSPLHAAWLSAAIARGGEPVRPVLVSEVVDGGKVRYAARTGLAQKRALRADTARAVGTMMEATVSGGTGYRAFRDPKGREFLPGIAVASKTGTLTDAARQRYYTWFAGYAPSKPVAFSTSSGGRSAQPRKVAFGVLAVNDAKWTIKANTLAREVLRAYFAEQKVPGVTWPRAQVREARPPARSTTPGKKQRRQRGS